MLSDGWSTDLLAVEIGTTGYCSILYCFKELGLRNIFIRIRSTIKKVSNSSIECSFCICVAGNEKKKNGLLLLISKPKILQKPCNSPAKHLLGHHLLNRLPSQFQRLIHLLHPVGSMKKGNMKWVLKMQIIIQDRNTLCLEFSAWFG